MKSVIFKDTHGMIQERIRGRCPQMETLGWGWSWLKSPKLVAQSNSELRQPPPSQGNLRVENTPLPRPGGLHPGEHDFPTALYYL